MFGFNQHQMIMFMINAKSWNDSHTSGTSLSHNERNVGRRNIRVFSDKKPIREQYLIVKTCQLAEWEFSASKRKYDKGRKSCHKEIIKTILQYQFSNFIL